MLFSLILGNEKTQNHVEYYSLYCNLNNNTSVWSQHYLPNTFKIHSNKLSSHSFLKTDKERHTKRERVVIQYSASPNYCTTMFTVYLHCVILLTCLYTVIYTPCFKLCVFICILYLFCPHSISSFFLLQYLS